MGQVVSDMGAVVVDSMAVRVGAVTDARHTAAVVAVIELKGLTRLSSVLRVRMCSRFPIETSVSVFSESTSIKLLFSCTDHGTGIVVVTRTECICCVTCAERSSPLTRHGIGASWIGRSIKCVSLCRIFASALLPLHCFVFGVVQRH